MHYNEIKKLTSRGRYCVDVDLGELAEKIDRFLNEYDLELCPDFQRGHVWTQEQQAKYCEFMLRGGHTNNEFLFNHPGWMGSFKGDFVLVDGLQRLTALRAMLEDKLPVFGVAFSSIEENWRFMGSVAFKININNLKTRKEVLTWYLELNSNGTPHSSEEINKVQRLLEEVK